MSGRVIDSKLKIFLSSKMRKLQTAQVKLSNLRHLNIVSLENSSFRLVSGSLVGILLFDPCLMI